MVIIMTAVAASAAAAVPSYVDYSYLSTKNDDEDSMGVSVHLYECFYV